MTTQETDIFALTTRLKLRFSTSRGDMTAEDLWDLPLQHQTKVNLDDIACALHNKLQLQDGQKSFVKPAMKTTNIVQLQFDVVKAIIDAKVAERDAAVVKRVNAEQRQKLQEIIAKKQDDALGGLSLEELQAQLDALPQ